MLAVRPTRVRPFANRRRRRYHGAVCPGSKSHRKRPSSSPRQPADTANRVLIERQSQIDEFCTQVRGEGRFGFDTEFVMEDRFEPEVCLIQVASHDTVALIDPFLALDLTPIWELVADPQVETVVHAGQEDLALCVQHTGRIPQNIFDVQVAAGFVGLDYPLSLQKLIQSTLHVRLHKAKTLTDWRRRPLSESQLQYGAEDVAHLLEVRGKLMSRLERRGRVDWAMEEMKRFEVESLYSRAGEDKLRRLKGTSSMKGQQLAVVRGLLRWRDELAEQLNRPARVVLKDHLLVEIARLGSTSFSEIRDLRGLNLNDRNVRALGRAVASAMALPPDQWPEPKPREAEPPREEVLIALATAVVRSYCLDYGLAYSLVAKKSSIQDLIRHRSVGRPEGAGPVELLVGWRATTVGALLDDVLAGRRTVRVESVNGDPVVHVTDSKDDQSCGA